MSAPVSDIARGSLIVPGASGYLTLPDGTLWTPHESTAPGAEVGLDRVIPRVCMAPSYAFSSGTEAIELAASAGLILDPWQQLCLILGLGETVYGKWAAFQVALLVSRQNGKGSILEALELFWLFGTGEQLIGHSAHEYKTAMEAFRRVLSLVTNTDDLRKKVKKVINTNGEEGIELLTGQRLRFMARSKGAGRGFTFHKLIWDEAYALTSEQQDAQLPTLSAVQNPQIWVTSSPPLDSASGEPLFNLKRLARVMSGGMVYMDYGAPGSLDKLEEVDLDDERLALLANPAAPQRITLETMQRERIAMGQVGYARERLGIWPPDLTQGFSVISKEQWDAMCDPHSGSDVWQDKDFPHPGLPADAFARIAQRPPTALIRRPVLSVDVSPRNQGVVSSSISLASMREDGKRHIELIKKGSGTAWLVQDLITLAKKLKAIAIVVDPGSPAGSILAELESAVTQEVIRERLDEDLILLMTARDVAQAFGMIYDAANGTELSVTHIGQLELAIAVGGGMTRPIGDGHAWDRRNATIDITPLVSVTHALWGLAKIAQADTEQVLVAWG